MRWSAWIVLHATFVERGLCPVNYLKTVKMDLPYARYLAIAIYPVRGHFYCRWCKGAGAPMWRSRARCDRAVGYMRDMSLATAKTTTVCKGLELFASVTELYADMYVARDLTNKVKWWGSLFEAVPQTRRYPYIASIRLIPRQAMEIDVSPWWLLISVSYMLRLRNILDSEL